MFMLCFSLNKNYDKHKKTSLSIYQQGSFNQYKKQLIHKRILIIFRRNKVLLN